MLLPLCAEVWAACLHDGHAGCVVTYADFRQITRSRSGAGPVATEAALGMMTELLRLPFPPPRGIRLLGVTLSNLQEDGAPRPGQMALPLL